MGFNLLHFLVLLKQNSHICQWKPLVTWLLIPSNITLVAFVIWFNGMFQTSLVHFVFQPFLQEALVSKKQEFKT